MLAKKLKEAKLDHRGHVHPTSEKSTNMSQMAMAPSTCWAATPPASPISTDDNSIIDNQPLAQHPPDIGPPSSNGNNDANQDDQDVEGPKDPQKILGM